MRKTNLIMFEGLSGSGKSTLAHFISRQLNMCDIAHIWYYEEIKQHPLYTFLDYEGMQQIFQMLAQGEYQQVIAAALEKWQALADALQASNALVIIDGCLYGYLTWTLFPFAIPQEAIHAYLNRVEQIIGAYNPCLIYLYQENIATALNKIATRRDSDVEQNIQHITQSAYGQRQGLQGFAGLVSYWQEYRKFTDEAFSHTNMQKVALENSAGTWPIYQQQVLDFLELPVSAEPSFSQEELEYFCGTYYFQVGEANRTCVIKQTDGDLYLDGVPGIWPNNRLVALAQNTFAIASFPFEVRFVIDEQGMVAKMVITGPELLFETVSNVFTRKYARS